MRVSAQESIKLEPELPKICQIYQDLDQMVRPKYPRMKQKVEKLMRNKDEPDFPFRMKAIQI